MNSRSITYDDQFFESYANLPSIRTPNGGRKLVDDPDLWFASKINATLKGTSASSVYWDKKEQEREKQLKFIRGVRNHSWNRQHMGSLLVAGIDYETQTSSLVSSAFTLGKFYKMQQQTRRSVILKDVIETEALKDNQEVKSNFDERFAFYWDIVDNRKRKVKGFDPIIQDAFKILPVSTKTRFSGTLDLRTVKGYTRWRNIEYLPSHVRKFASNMHQSTLNEYPEMFQSFNLRTSNKENEAMYERQLLMADRIGSDDLMDEPMLWYADHSFLLPENKYFNRIYIDFKIKEILDKSSPDAMLLGYFNPLGIKLEDIVEMFRNKDEESKSAIELASFAFISKIDLSGGIDTWRHTRSNRMVQPIYHALTHGNEVLMPSLYKKKEVSGSEIPEKFMEMSREALTLYHSLLKEGIPEKEAINVLPHNFELIQVEMMDIFAYLNMMAIRTCIHARPDVQDWARALLRETGKIKDFEGIDRLSDRENLLARGLVFSYCSELGNCKKCGKDVIYLPDPLVK
ncbi:MAG: FAD-dependent thymidylate synthase [Candidatus Heimdallarchaeota archaeon]|nr:FAD-dependent thymidylate synthase [Candidatus Heimdallarchaeota archaeon]